MEPNLLQILHLPCLTPATGNMWWGPLRWEQQYRRDVEGGSYWSADLPGETTRSDPKWFGVGSPFGTNSLPKFFTPKDGVQKPQPTILEVLGYLTLHRGSSRCYWQSHNVVPTDSWWLENRSWTRERGFSGAVHTRYRWILPKSLQNWAHIKSRDVLVWANHQYFGGGVDSSLVWYVSVIQKFSEV